MQSLRRPTLQRTGDIFAHRPLPIQLKQFIQLPNWNGHRSVISVKSRLALASESAVSAGAAEAARRLEAAIAAFRQLLPEHGLKMIVPPPLPDGHVAPIALSAWRRGSVAVPVHRGSHARQAMLLLLAATAERDRQSLAEKSCARCGGVGWIIGQAGVRTICPHSQARP
jgi:hypothetical protein